ncbi:MAG: hypothetical protein OD918_03770 [Gammaproteobacteria bacterium]
MHTLRIEIPRDGIVEGDEQFRAELLADDPAWPAGYTAVAGKSAFTFTVRDADRASFAVKPASALIGERATITAEFLTGARLRPIPGGAPQYEIPPITMRRDDLSEGVETFTLAFDTGHINWPAGFWPNPRARSLTIKIRNFSG